MQLQVVVQIRIPPVLLPPGIQDQGKSGSDVLAEPNHAEHDLYSGITGGGVTTFKNFRDRKLQVSGIGEQESIFILHDFQTSHLLIVSMDQHVDQCFAD